MVAPNICELSVHQTPLLRPFVLPPCQFTPPLNLRFLIFGLTPVGCSRNAVLTLYFLWECNFLFRPPFQESNYGVKQGLDVLVFASCHYCRLEFWSGSQILRKLAESDWEHVGFYTCSCSISLVCGVHPGDWSQMTWCCVPRWPAQDVFSHVLTREAATNELILYNAWTPLTLRSRNRLLLYLHQTVHVWLCPLQSLCSDDVSVLP
jgi:hypothetical protein